MHVYATTLSLYKQHTIINLAHYINIPINITKGLLICVKNFIRCEIFIFPISVYFN